MSVPTGGKSYFLSGMGSAYTYVCESLPAKWFKTMQTWLSSSIGKSLFLVLSMILKDIQITFDCESTEPLYKE